MRRSLVAWIALVGLTFVPAPSRADESTPAKPAFIVRLASVDTALADLRHLAKLAGKADEASELEEIVNKAGEGGGLNKAIDRKRPLGVYGSVGTKGMPVAVVLLPIANREALLEFAENSLGSKPEKGKDGIYTVNLPQIPFLSTLYAVFASDYCYLSNSREALGEQRLAPSDVLPAGKIGLVWATFRIDQVPTQLKQLVLQQIDLDMAKVKEKPARSEHEARVRGAVTDQVSKRFRLLMREGGAVDLHIGLDRETEDFTISLRIAGKPGSELADCIHELAKVPSLGAALVSDDSALDVVVHLRLPEEVRQSLSSEVEELPKKASARAHSEQQGEIIRTLLTALEPTLKAGELDAGLDLRGPSPDGVYTLVAGVRVKDGAGIDKALHQIVKDLPAEARNQIKLDADKAGETPIHRLTPEKMSKEARRTLGEGPLYIAVREDAVLVAAGDKALEALKEAIAVQPKAGRIVQVEASLKRLAPLMEKEHPGASAAAQKAFTQKGSDRVRLTIEGGDALEVRLSAFALLIKFADALDKDAVHKGRKKPGRDD